MVFTPHELMEKLVALIPRPRTHLVRYHGILGPAAEDRDKVVPSSAEVEYGHGTAPAEPRPDSELRAGSAQRGRYRQKPGLFSPGEWA